MNKWAIIGSGGFIAPRHKAAIEHVGDRIILTCDVNPQVRPDFTDRQEMYRSKEWDLVTHVAVCAPNDMHYTICVEAVERGKVVLCEKPLTLSDWSCAKLDKNVFTVLQLRHHPEVIKAKEQTTNAKQVSLVVKVKRDASYWHGWKGQDRRSGGILFNLGIHYFDLLIHLFGDKYEIVQTKRAPKVATGTLMFGPTRVDYHIEIMDDNKGQERSLTIDGQEVVLSKEDNLSFEDLHKKVYEALVFYKTGVTPAEARKSIALVEKLTRL